jgi:hypothetical protein
MKLVIDVDDSKAKGFLEMLKSHAYVKTKQLSAPDAAVLEELNHIKKALKLAEKVKNGTIKSRPASEFLNEL